VAEPLAGGDCLVLGAHPGVRVGGDELHSGSMAGFRSGRAMCWLL
jgi:hypothetical protein